MSAYSALYAAAVARGLQIGSHESDLYLPDTPETRALVKEYGLTCSGFVSQIDGKPWLDVPFAYMPWWERRA